MTHIQIHSTRMVCWVDPITLMAYRITDLSAIRQYRQENPLTELEDEDALNLFTYLRKTHFEYDTSIHTAEPGEVPDSPVLTVPEMGIS